MNQVIQQNKIYSTSKHFTVEVEYDTETAIIHTDVLLLKGLRRKGIRPAYITVSCNRDEATYVCTEGTRKLISMLSGSLRPPAPYASRIICKPYWFHKFIYSI